MVIVKIYVALILLVAQACGTANRVESRNSPDPGEVGKANFSHYKDPDGAFSISIREGWKVERNKHEEQWVALLSIDKHAWATLISSDKHNAARLLILSFKQPPMNSYPDELKARMLAGIGEPIFKGWIGSLREQTQVKQVNKVYKTMLAAKDAFRQDVTYYRGDQYDPRKGYGIFLMGNHTALFITLTGNDEGVKALESMLSSLQVEPAN